MKQNCSPTSSFFLFSKISILKRCHLVYFFTSNKETTMEPLNTQIISICMTLWPLCNSTSFMLIIKKKPEIWHITPSLSETCFYSAERCFLLNVMGEFYINSTQFIHNQAIYYVNMGIKPNVPLSNILVLISSPLYKT